VYAAAASGSTALKVEMDPPVLVGEAGQSKQIVDFAGGKDLQAMGAVAIRDIQ
jgi:hypothetical protein